jgi:hypothetical protein
MLSGCGLCVVTLEKMFCGDDHDHDDLDMCMYICIYLGLYIHTYVCM